MRADVFHRTYNRVPEKGRVLVFTVEVEAGASLEAILAAAQAAGLPKGGASSGVFEVQTDEGVWATTTARVLRPCNAVFTTWEALDAA